MEDRTINPDERLHVTKADAAILLGVLKDIRELLQQILNAPKPTAEKEGGC
jgi:hypothetical protein